MSEQGSRKDLWRILRQFPVCMLTTHDRGVLRSRPMAPAIDEDRQELLFLTRASSHTADEIGRHTEVNLSFADPEQDLFISVSGDGRLALEPDKARRLWNRYAEAFLPEGPDSPDVAVLHVAPTEAEYWTGGELRRMDEAELRA